MPRLGSNPGPQPEDVDAFISKFIGHLAAEPRVAAAIQLELLTIFGLYVPMVSIKAGMSAWTCSICGGSETHNVGQHKQFQDVEISKFLEKTREQGER